MRPLVAGLAVAGLMTFVVAGLALRQTLPSHDAGPEADRVVQEPAAAVPAPAPEAATQAPAVEPSAKGDRLPSRVRTVAPDVVAAPVLGEEPLERVEARLPEPARLSEARGRETRPRLTILHRPHAIAAGTFHSLGHTVRLAGIETPNDRETCVSGGVSWPCGVHARTAFRNWLRGRALSCVVPQTAGREVVVTECSLGRQDPAEWLVRYGWARALADGPYAELERQARAEGLGLHGPAPQAAAPATAASGG